jgi:hypothetical protein
MVELQWEVNTRDGDRLYGMTGRRMVANNCGMVWTIVVVEVSFSVGDSLFDVLSRR